MAMLIILLAALPAPAAQGQVAVIANPSVPDQRITSSQLLDFYTGDLKLWSDGQAIVLFDLKTKGEVKDAFYRFIGKPSSRMKSIWMKNMLSGEGKPPESLDSESAMLAKVAETPGAIGYVSAEIVDKRVIVLALIPAEAARE